MAFWSLLFCCSTEKDHVGEGKLPRHEGHVSEQHINKDREIVPRHQVCFFKDVHVPFLVPFLSYFVARSRKMVSRLSNERLDTLLSRGRILIIYYGLLDLDIYLIQVDVLVICTKLASSSVCGGFPCTVIHVFRV